MSDKERILYIRSFKLVTLLLCWSCEKSALRPLQVCIIHAAHKNGDDQVAFWHCALPVPYQKFPPLPIPPCFCSLSRSPVECLFCLGCSLVKSSECEVLRSEGKTSVQLLLSKEIAQKQISSLNNDCRSFYVKLLRLNARQTVRFSFLHLNSWQEDSHFPHSFRNVLNLVMSWRRKTKVRALKLEVSHVEFELPSFSFWRITLMLYVSFLPCSFYS